MFDIVRRKRGLSWPTLALLMVASCLSSCRNPELARLQEENARLRRAISELEGAEGVKLARIDEFTVGLAASEKNFDENAFLELLNSSLKASAVDDSRFTVAVEDNEQQIAKVRGMLIQQYLSEKKVPIRVSNITYKLKDPQATFEIGGTTIPRDGAVLERTPDGLNRITYRDPISASMERDSAGKYSISYQDSDGGRGVIRLTLKDVEVFSTRQEPKSARQGDISLNWQLSLEKIQVYRVTDLAGDIGKFMLRMRYPTLRSSLNQFQTIRDSVYLFAYGPYTTGLVQRMQTPAYIDQVEVRSLDSDLFDSLEAGLPEEELTDIFDRAQSQWINCEFVEQSGDQKTWERPVLVQFPFVSRQTSLEKDLVFYTKYNQEGSQLIGDYRIRTN